MLIELFSCSLRVGFDEWFGNLYHLNAEEEPEELDYPGEKNPEYKTKFGPETDLIAMRVDAWKMHIGVKHHGKLG